MAYENLSREELISALENLTGVDQFAAGAATDPNVGGASVVPPVDPSRMGGILPIPTSWPELPEGVSPYRAEPYRPPPEGTPFYKKNLPYFPNREIDPFPFMDRRPAPYNPDASGNPEDFLDRRPAPFNPDAGGGFMSPMDASVVRPIGETIDSVMRQPEQGRAPIGDPGFEPASEQDLMFHRVQRAVRRGEEPEAPQWMIDMVRAVPEEDWASAFAGGDEALRAFHQKHGFPPAVGG